MFQLNSIYLNLRKSLQNFFYVNQPTSCPALSEIQTHICNCPLNILHRMSESHIDSAFLKQNFTYSEVNKNYILSPLA